MRGICFSYVPEDEDYGWVQLDVDTGEFRGTAGTWNHPSCLLDFAHVLDTYPIDPDHALHFATPASDRSGFSIRIEPLGNRGLLVMRLMLVDDGPHQDTLSTSIELRYPALQELQLRLLDFIAQPDVPLRQELR